MLDTRKSNRRHGVLVSGAKQRYMNAGHAEVSIYTDCCTQSGTRPTYSTRTALYGIPRLGLTEDTEY
ncbi:hypothetical protein J6590_044389 [Homalodisca vitripennis]|nr:hypothetical protein J6590_044389 [Homalodisca vitripennis]